MSQFSPELCKLESSDVVDICRMNDCIVGLRLRVMDIIFLFFTHFSFFPYITCKCLKFVGVFSGTFKAKMLKVGIHMDNELLYYGIENQTPCLSSFLCSIQ